MSTKSSRLGKRKIVPNVVEEVVVDDGHVSVRTEELVLSRYHPINKSPSTHVSHNFNPEQTWICRGSLKGIKEIYDKISTNAIVRGYLESTGWRWLFMLDFPKSDHSVCEALIGCWWDSTHTFNFPNCELGITPMDFTTITGISIGEGQPPPYDGRPYSDFEATKRLYFADCETLVSVKDGGIPLVQFRWYWEQACNVKEDDEGGLGVRIARAFMCFVIGKLLFPNAPSVFYFGWLAALHDISSVGMYDWGGAILARIYSSLDQCSRNKGRSLECFWQLIEYWFFEYTNTCHPPLKQMKNDIFYPRLARWERKNRNTVRGAKRFNKGEVISQISQRNGDNIKWSTFHCQRYNAHAEYVRAFDLSMRRVVLWDPVFCGYFYLGDRCRRQVDNTITIPDDPPAITSVIGRDYYDMQRSAGWPLADRYLIHADQQQYSIFWEFVTRGVFPPSLVRSVNVDVLLPTSIHDPRVRVPHEASAYGDSFVYNTHSSMLPPLTCTWTTQVVSSSGKVEYVAIPSTTDTPALPPPGAYTTEQWREYSEETLKINMGLQKMVLDSTRQLAHVQSELARERASHTVPDVGRCTSKHTMNDTSPPGPASFESADACHKT